MPKKHKLSSLSVAVGTVFTAGMLTSGAASAESNPFGYADLSSGYMVATGEGAKGEGEGSCGGKRKAEGEGNCGGKKKAEGEGSCGGKKEQGQGRKQGQEGKCGEGKCGGNM